VGCRRPRTQTPAGVSSIPFIVPASLANRLTEHTTVTFTQTQDQEARPILSRSGIPLNLDLLARLSRKSSGGGFGGGMRRHRVGFPGGGSGGSNFPGDPTGGSGYSAQEESAGTELGGQIWTAASVPGDGDPDQLATTELCAIMPFAPGLKDLSSRLGKSKTTLVAAVFSIAVLDRQGAQPPKPPAVSIEVESIESSTVDPAPFHHPRRPRRSSPPRSPWALRYGAARRWEEAPKVQNSKLPTTQRP
jgi:hypothetical protein